MTIQVGERISNGAFVVAFHADSDKSGIILGLLRHEYVTWCVNTDTGATFSGHYFDDDIVKASLDYADRCGFDA